MIQLFYVLDGKKVVPADMYEAEAFFESPDRIVKQEMVGDLLVSTVFLVIRHLVGCTDGCKRVPILFETMVFDGRKEIVEFTRRYRSWDEAYAGHVDTVNKLKEGKNVY